ncbi:ABC transporter substrate-binding protein [Actinocorallia longicatena]|uniref:ABC transporter substrate-binding protein n=1 Tax=Actinocorallia longicatena TaxID=111803 RepID=UPI0031E0322F
MASRSIAVGALVLVGSLGLAACGEKDKDDAAAKPAITATGGPDTALAAQVPADVKADGVIKVGVDSSYAPNEYLDTDGKTVIGWDKELFDAVAAKLGLKAEFVTSSFTDIVPGVSTAGKYEVGVSSFTINAERLKQVSMVSYYSAGTLWFAKNGVTIDTKDVCGKKIAVQTGTVQDEEMTAKSKECEKAGKPKITIDKYQKQDQATASVASGKDEAGLADSPIAAYAVKKSNGALAAVGDIYDAAPYGFVVKKGSPLAAAIAGATKALIADGTYKAILEKWGVEGGALTTDPAVDPES